MKWKPLSVPYSLKKPCSFCRSSMDNLISISFSFFHFAVTPHRLLEFHFLSILFFLTHTLLLLPRWLHSMMLFFLPPRANAHTHTHMRSLKHTQTRWLYSTLEAICLNRWSFRFKTGTAGELERRRKRRRRKSGFPGWGRWIGKYWNIGKLWSETKDKDGRRRQSRCVEFVSAVELIKCCCFPLENSKCRLLPLL